MNSLAAQFPYSQCDKDCGGVVYILIISLLLLVFFAALTLGLVSVLQELVERYCQGEPMFGEQGRYLPRSGIAQSAAKTDRNFPGSLGPILRDQD